jgi:dihydrofolate reductase
MESAPNIPAALEAIAAVSLNGIIGADNRIPWRLPEDFAWFKRRTMGQFVLMGRRTFESLGRPLPGRTTIVFTRHPRELMNDPAFASASDPAHIGNWSLFHAGCELDLHALTERDVLLVDDPAGFLAHLARHGAGRRVCVIGGAEIYRMLLPHCSDLWLSHVHRTIPGDTAFPPFADRFALAGVPVVRTEFEVRHYRARAFPSRGA